MGSNSEFNYSLKKRGAAQIPHSESIKVKLLHTYWVSECIKLRHPYTHAYMSQSSSTDPIRLADAISSVSTDILFGSVSCCSLSDTLSRLGKPIHSPILFTLVWSLWSSPPCIILLLLHHFSPKHTTCIRTTTHQCQWGVQLCRWSLQLALVHLAPPIYRTLSGDSTSSVVLLSHWTRGGRNTTALQQATATDNIKNYLTGQSHVKKEVTLTRLLNPVLLDMLRGSVGLLTSHPVGGMCVTWQTLCCMALSFWLSLYRLSSSFFKDSEKKSSCYPL